jgi:hypothetical protein
LVDGVLLVVASAGLAISPSAATEAIKAFIFGCPPDCRQESVGGWSNRSCRISPPWRQG